MSLHSEPHPELVEGRTATDGLFELQADAAFYSSPVSQRAMLLFPPPFRQGNRIWLI